MKVLMIIPGLSRKLGGTTTLSLGFYKHLKQHVHVELATSYIHEEEKKGYDQELLNDPHIHLFKSTFSFYKFSLSLRSFLKKNVKNYDLVHVHGLWHPAAYPAASIARAQKVPFVISPHGMLEEDAFARSGWKKSLFWNFLYKKVFASAIGIHCTALSEVHNTLKFDSEANTFHVPNGIDLPEIEPKPRKGKLLFMGRLHEKKAVDKIIEVMPHFPNLSLSIAGTGSESYTTLLKAKVDEFKLHDRVHFAGFVNGDLKTKMFQESMFAMVPSYSEGLPLTALESLSNGTPLLITKASNVPEVTEYKCGLEIDNNDVSTIKEGLDFLLNEDYDVLSQNARNLAEEKFYWPNVARQLFENYKALLNESR